MTCIPYDQFCVARYGDACCALPANMVREVMVCPDVACLPNASSILRGISHVNNEFLTITDPLATISGNSDSELRNQLMVITTDDGPWGMLVDEIVELTNLKDYQPENIADGVLTFSGTATYRGHRLRTLDVEETYRAVLSELRSHWQHGFRNLEFAQEA